MTQKNQTEFIHWQIPFADKLYPSINAAIEPDTYEEPKLFLIVAPKRRADFN